MPSRMLLEVLLALMAALTVLSFMAAPGSLTVRALALYLAAGNVVVAALAIGRGDPHLRLLAASVGAGLTLGAGVSHVLTVGAAFIPPSRSGCLRRESSTASPGGARKPTLRGRAWAWSQRVGPE